MLSVGRCDFARLQMKFGHMDGMHCFIDSTSILVKIKSVSLCNCRTVYYTAYRVVITYRRFGATYRSGRPQDAHRGWSLKSGMCSLTWPDQLHAVPTPSKSPGRNMQESNNYFMTEKHLEEARRKIKKKSLIFRTTPSPAHPSIRECCTAHRDSTRNFDPINRDVR